MAYFLKQKPVESVVIFESNICRLCASTSETLIPIFDKTPFNKDDLFGKIKKCFPSLSIVEDDSKPKNVCLSCFSKLEICNELFDISVAAESKFNSILNRHCSIQNREPVVPDSCSLKEVENCIWLEDEAKDGKALTVHDRNVIVLSKLDSSGLDLQPEPNRDFVVMVELKYKDPEQLDHDKSKDQLVAIDCDQSEMRDADHCLSTDLMFFQSDEGQTKSSDKYLRLISNNLDADSRAPAKSSSAVVKKKTVCRSGGDESGDGAGPGSLLTLSKVFACSVCGKQFQRRTRLNSHMALHTEVRPHTCDQCGAAFAMRWDLTLHRRLHTRAFSCDFCQKTFNAKSKLERHLRTHTGERPHTCAHCDKSFGDKRNLDNHLRTHTGEKPFVCRVCARAFRVRTHLTDHQRVHSKEMPYKCAHCAKTFRWKANYNLHYKSHATAALTLK